MRRTMAKASFHTAMNLLAFAVIATLILVSVHQLTLAPIKASEEHEKLELISQIAPIGSYNNEILKDTIPLAPDALLGSEETTIAYRARLDNQPAMMILEAIAPDGYSGRIRLIMAIRADGSLSGVRVVAHKETPGLGDYIEIARDNWIKGFDGRSLDNTREADWKVKKDGGVFAYRAGATITPRAIVKAVHKALLYYRQHQQTLWQQAVVVKGEAT